MKKRDLDAVRNLKPREEVYVHQVVELFDKDDKTRVEQHYFVLATGIEQALAIVGKDERREAIFVKQLCQITQLPDDVYAIVYLK